MQTCSSEQHSRELELLNHEARHVGINLQTNHQVPLEKLASRGKASGTVKSRTEARFNICLVSFGLNSTIPPFCLMFSADSSDYPPLLFSHSPQFTYRRREAITSLQVDVRSTGPGSESNDPTALSDVFPVLSRCKPMSCTLHVPIAVASKRTMWKEVTSHARWNVSQFLF